MQFSVAELPLALFTTLAPLGAGAFIALACAFFTTSFSDEQLKKIDRGTIIPLAIVIVGFICAFFHLASPMNAPSVFLGAGSPMSNEIIAGCVFAIVAIVYVIVTNTGKLCGSARKGFAAVVAVLAVIVREGSSVQTLNDLLHQYGPYIIGRMGVPYREKGVNIISVALDAPGDVISALSGKLGRLDGITAKTVYAPEGSIGKEETK